VNGQYVVNLLLEVFLGLESWNDFVYMCNLYRFCQHVFTKKWLHRDKSDVYRTLHTWPLWSCCCILL